MSEIVTPPSFEHECCGTGPCEECDCYERYVDDLADGGWAE